MKKHLAIVLLAAVNFCSYAQLVTVKSLDDSGSNEQLTLNTLTPSISETDGIRELADAHADAISDSVPPSSLSLDKYVYSATRWMQPIKEIPAKITTISAKQIALMNPQTTADLVGSSGEIFIQKSQLGGGTLMIRGFATNRVLLVVDGVRMNTAIFHSSNQNNVISLDPMAIDNAEILFGPASVIYGSDAIGGVMHFQTLAPSLSPGKKPMVTGNAVARFSSADLEFTGHLDLNIGLKKWAFLTSFSQSSFNDLRMGSHGPDEYLRTFYVQREDSLDVMLSNDNPLIQKSSGYKQTNIMEKILFRPNENWEVNYGFHFSTTSDIPKYDLLTKTTDDGLPKYAEWHYGPQIWMLNNLNLVYTCAADICDRFELRLAHQYFEEGRTERTFNGPVRDFRGEKVNALSINFDLVKFINAKHQLNYGMEVIYNNVRLKESDLNIITGESIPLQNSNPQSGWGSYGLYLDYHFRINDKFNFEAGARYNIYQLDAYFDTVYYDLPYSSASINNDAFTASIGTVYRPGQDWSLSARLSTAFRAPNLDDIGKVFETESESFIIPNPNLEAEYSYNADISVVKIFNDIIKIDLTGYYTFLQDALVRQEYIQSGQDTSYAGEHSNFQDIQNASHAYVAGLQAGVEVDLPAGFGFSSRFNLQKGKEITGNGTWIPLQYAAPCFGTANVTWSDSKISTNLYIAYSGQVSSQNLPPQEKSRDYQYALDKDGNPYSPAWYTLNVKLMYQVNKIFSLSGGIENITDVRYRPYSSGISAPGRNFIVALKASF